jgi:hypothetical protein
MEDTKEDFMTAETAPRRRRGRPTGIRRPMKFTVRLTSEEYAAIQEAARLAECSMAGIVQWAIALVMEEQGLMGGET